MQIFCIKSRIQEAIKYYKYYIIGLISLILTPSDT